MVLSIALKLLSLLVPTLVAEAERSMPGVPGAEKRKWVLEGVHATIMSLDKILPAWAKTLEGPVEEIVDFFINQALDRLKV